MLLPNTETMHINETHLEVFEGRNVSLGALSEADLTEVDETMKDLV